MEVKLDKFGRILIPKAIRQKLSLPPEGKLELVYDEHTSSLVLSPVVSKGRVRIVVTESGIPVIHNGEQNTVWFDTVELIKQDREEYLNRKLGLDE